MIYTAALRLINKYSKCLCICIVLCIGSYFSKAQLVITGKQAADTLAAALVGPGITILSPSLTCAPNANGRFVAGVVSPIDIPYGIVLTTGSAIDSILSPGDTAYFGISHPASAIALASSAWGLPGDADLSALASGEVTEDACILEFDVVPAGDTIKFNYVFGSEEYASYACSSFNDVFGFFITGGVYSTPTNLALVPGTSIPVCINSVNCGATGGGSTSTCSALGTGSPFCTYYVDNLDTTAVANPYVVYAGLTTLLQAVAPVSPCDTYHLKLAIADGVDDNLDSGVFIAGGSLTSTAVTIIPQGINAGASGAQYCVRGCTDGKFLFRATGNLKDSTVIHYVVSGTAENGTDYTTIPDSVVIPAHDSSTTITIHGLAVPASGPKAVNLLIYAAYTCGGAPIIVDSAELIIYDSLYVHINTPDTGICIGDNVTINVSGSSAFNYLWAPGATLNSTTILSPTATPATTTTYAVQASYPASGCPPSHASITITVVAPPDLNIGPSVHNTCVGVPVPLNVITGPPSALYYYKWTPATYLNNSTIINPVLTPTDTGNQEYIVTVGTIGVVGCAATDSFLLHVLPDDFTLVSQDTNTCFYFGPFQAIAFGDSAFSYQWTPIVGVSNPNILSPTITPPGDGVHTYSITGSYPGCPDMVHSVTYDIQDPNVKILTSDTLYCLGTIIPIPVEITPATEPYTFSWSPATGLSDTSVTGPDFFVSTLAIHTYHITIQSSLGCKSTDSITFTPAPAVSINISPGNSIIDYGGSIQLNATNLTPDNPLFYYWYPDNGTLDNTNINDPVATPTDSTTYTVVGMNSYGCRDTMSETIYVDKDVPECLPSAFTPNHDGLNDEFRICNTQYQKLVEFCVFNRWGQKIYENNTDITKGWDGTFNGIPQDIGVYNYLIIIAKPDGTNKTYSGNVTLLR